MGLSDIARSTERLINRVGTKRATRAGWTPAVEGYFGYGDTTRLRILGRVLMRGAQTSGPQRGFRQFFTIQVGDHPVTLTAGSQQVTARTDAGGYIDVLIYDHGLTPGWHEVLIDAEGGEPVSARVLVLSSDVRYGLISDIDDTVMVTMLPRALHAAYNSWYLRTNARKPVPGMSSFYRALRERFGGDMPVFYLSTGAWNTFPALVSFLKEHGFPLGPLLLTDWGPTPTGLFRSGQEHKKVQLRNLLIDFPDIHWILVGDDGQHDPLIYSGLIAEHPSRVSFVAIRQLTPGEHVLAHGTAVPLSTVFGSPDVPWIEGEDGHELKKQIPGSGA